MDFPTGLNDEADELDDYEIVTISASNAANLQAAIERWRVAYTASTEPFDGGIFGYSIGAAGDGGAYYAVINAAEPSFAEPFVDFIPPGLCRFIVREGGTGDNANAITTDEELDPAIQPIPTGALIQESIFADPLVQQFGPDPTMLQYGAKVGGCNAGRRFVLLIAVAAFIDQNNGGPAVELNDAMRRSIEKFKRGFAARRARAEEPSAEEEG